MLARFCNVASISLTKPLNVRFTSAQLAGSPCTAQLVSVALDPSVTLTNCAVHGDPASCALVKRTFKGFVNEIDATLQNLASIHVRTFDAGLSYRSPQIGRA